jgi:hypothetical protein
MARKNGNSSEGSNPSVSVEMSLTRVASKLPVTRYDAEDGSVLGNGYFGNGAEGLAAIGNPERILVTITAV